MNSLPAGSIRVDGVSKQFRRYEDTPTLAYGMMHALKRGRRSKLWAVNDLSLQIQPGEAVGVIGRNGSGKSTLLQMLCGVTGPTAGTVHVAGRIAPLIAVGVGFHPELTGRENIFVNGTILGLTRNELDHRLDAIVAFSEIEQFLDSPVKFYSSGMFVRLGFSVAAHVDPDVLLIDEVLAVGDLGFQMKCYQHMAALRDSGCTVVTVSHNMTALEQHCDRGVFLAKGDLAFDGPIGDAVTTYYDSLHLTSDDENQGKSEYPFELDALEENSATIVDDMLKARTRFDSGESLTLRVRVLAARRIAAPFIWLRVLSEDGIMVYRDSNRFEPFPPLEPGMQADLCVQIQLPLATGAYTLEWLVVRGPQDDRGLPSSASTDVANLTAPRRIGFRVRGRAIAGGIADLAAKFG